MRVDIGNRVREFRRLSGLTQQELARRVGVSAVFISKTERGLKLPSLDTLLRLAKALDVPPNWLLCDVVVQSQKPPALFERIAELPRGKRRQLIGLLEELLTLLRLYEEEPSPK